MRTRQLDRTRIIWLLALFLLLGAGLFFTAGCGALQNIASIIQPPKFEQDDRPAEIRFLPPSLAQPAGGHRQRDRLSARWNGGCGRGAIRTTDVRTDDAGEW